MSAANAEQHIRRWHTDDPKRLVARGHPVGDQLAAYDWEVLERGRGLFRLRIPLAESVKNPRGELFGGYTPTYADFISLHTFHTTREPGEPRQWLGTASMRVDYFEPIRGPEFEVLAEVVHRRGRTGHVLLQFFNPGGIRAAMAHVTLVERRGESAE